MSVRATGSTFTRNSRLYLAVICLGMGAWFAYDGWFGEYGQRELDKNDGKPTVNLLVNRYLPIPLALVAIGSFITGLGITSKFVEAQEQGLRFSDGRVIPYENMTQIDKRSLQDKGYFVIQYQQDHRAQSVKLSDRKYDHLSDLLDEIIKKTGAQPAADPQQEQQSTPG